MDNMRDEFAKLKRHERHCNAAESRYWCKQYRLFAERLLNEQAAQAVPVVDIDATGLCYNGVHMAPVVDNITTAELERLRNDAERGRLLINRGEWLRFDHDTPDAYALLAVRVPYTADLSCKAMREDAIDAAIAGEKK